MDPIKNILGNQEIILKVDIVGSAPEVESFLKRHRVKILKKEKGLHAYSSYPETVLTIKTTKSIAAKLDNFINRKGLDVMTVSV